MTVWPSEYEDTVNYRPREIISSEDITFRMIDKATFSLWGDIYHNGIRFQTSTYIDASQFGVKYDGSDESVAFQKACNDIPAFSHLHISGPLKLGKTVEVKETISLSGEGWQSPISPTASFTGGPLVSIQHGGVGTEGSDQSHQRSIVVDNLVFDGLTRSVRAHGLRLNTLQESFFTRLQFWNLDGIGLDIYQSVRDCVFHTIIIRGCGNYDLDEPNLDITTKSGSTQDTTNNLAFYGVWSHLACGDLLHIKCETGGACRCFFFVGCKFHGVWVPGHVQGDGVLNDYYNTCRTVIQNARGVEFTNCRFHASAPGMPLVHLSSHPLQPGNNSVTNVGFSQVSFGNPAGPHLGTFNAAAGNEFLLTSHYFATGMLVRATTSDVTGISTATDYFVIRVSPDKIKLASKYLDAVNGVAITTGTTGTVALTTQEFRILIEENTYGDVRMNPGNEFDGPVTRPSIINKSFYQLVTPYVGLKYMGSVSYEGVVTQNDVLNNVEIEADLNHDGTKVGFYGTTPIVQPTNVTARAALESLGLGSGLTEPNTYSEYPPLVRGTGNIWYVPSMAHSAIWSGTDWKPLIPADPATNICCILGNSEFLTDFEGWNGLSGTGNLKNFGKSGSALNSSINVNVTQGTDAKNRKYAGFNGSTTDASMPVSTTWDIAAGDSFSVFVVKDQTTFAANTTIFGNRASAGSTTEAGWSLMAPDTSGSQRFIVGDGTVSTFAGSSVASGLRMILGIREISTDSVNISVPGQVTATTTDATTASLVSVNSPRLGRSGGAGIQRVAMNLYVAAFARRAYTATEITTLSTWATTRFAP